MTDARFNTIRTCLSNALLGWSLSRDQADDLIFEIEKRVCAVEEDFTMVDPWEEWDMETINAFFDSLDGKHNG